MYKDGKTTDNIYENIFATKGTFVKQTTDSNATRIQSSELTGSDSMRNRSFRAAVVCLVLLCVLLLTAVIVLCVTLTQEREQLKWEKNALKGYLGKVDGWIYYKSSFYFNSSEKKSWTESRRYCTERGADLIIINNRQEQDFVKDISGDAVFYIGLTDIDVEGSWKWVDGSTLTSGFWASYGQIREPNGGRAENCTVTVAKPPPEWPNLVGWVDVDCNTAYQWICEKRISQIKLP